MDGKSQTAILKRMAKLEAQFESFMKKFGAFESVSAPSELITGTEEYKSFKPIDSIESLDEFEENLKDADFEYKMVCRTHKATAVTANTNSNRW